MSEEDLIDLIAYIKSLGQPATTAARRDQPEEIRHDASGADVATREPPEFSMHRTAPTI